MKTRLLLIILVICSYYTNANNVVVSNVITTTQDVSAGANNVANFTNIQFDIDWENSWRVGSGPSNWDAVWVFAKYQITGGAGCTAASTWYHATLSSTAGHHSVTTNNGVAASITPSTDGKGLFLYRNGNGSGAINWDGVNMRWNYGQDMATSGIQDGCTVTLKVFAIEMVYIPTGIFYAGDGATAGITGQFTNANTSSPYQFTSENAITLGGGGVGSMGNNNAAGMTTADDFNNVTTRTLPLDFPKGYNAYYIMKYECTNEQYAEFLNTLNGTQQANRCIATTAGSFMCNAAGISSPQNRNAVKCRIAPVGATPGEYGCDLDNDNTFNEANDGKYIACCFMNSTDMMAYLDWAGLRVISETEYEKACRGNQVAVAGEYAWGNTTIHPTSYASLSNSGAANELPFNPSTAVGNAAYSTTTSVVGIQGPLRSGIFATSSSTRVSSGAGYYGVMEMTGNVWELAVSVGSVAGRSFTGLHGDGTLTTTGTANVDYWPGMNGNNTLTTANGTATATGCTGNAGLGFHGGCWINNQWLNISNRQYSYWNGVNNRDNRTGCRGVRTAP